MSPLGEHRSPHIYKTSALLNDGDTTAATESAATAPLRHATGGDLPALCALLNMSVAPGSQDTFDSRLAWIAMAKQQQMLVLQGTSGEPLAACTLLFEPKFLRGGSLIAHVDGVVPKLSADSPSPLHTGWLLSEAVEAARQRGCYKVILNAPMASEAQLAGLGFSQSQLTMEAILASPLPPEMAPMPIVKFEPFYLDDAKAFLLRPLDKSDKAADLTSLLAQLSVAPPLVQVDFEKRVEIVNYKGQHLVFVVERAADRALVACATMLVSVKPLGCGGYGTAYGNGDFSESLRAHIEDVVVDQSTRGTGLGAKLIKALVDIARQTQCRTAVLNCKEDNVGFYLKCGFVRTGKVCMSIYFDEATPAPPTA